MKHIYYAIFSLLISCSTHAQPTFYIQSALNINKVDNADPDNVHPIEWRVRLYKKNMPTVGNSYWGIIKGKSASEVMGKLQSSQEFELQFNSFMGKGRVQDKVFTNFNPLGPIAIVDESARDQPSDEKTNENIESLFEKAKDYFDVFKDVKAKMDVLIKGKSITPFDNTGKVFEEYTSNLKAAISQLLFLKNTLFSSSRQSLDQITLAIKNIDTKLNSAANYAETITNKMAEIQVLRRKQKYSNSEFIFLTASFENVGDEEGYSQKRLNFVSDPIPYDENFYEKKRAFETAIRQDNRVNVQLNEGSIWEHGRNGLSTSDRVSYTERIRSFTECEIEIENFKQKCSSGWNGNTKRFQIIDVNTGSQGDETVRDKPIPIRAYNEDEVDYKVKIQNLGVAYFNGEGVPKNYKKAFECFKVSANTGSGWHPSMVNLGMCYLQGIGTGKNYWEALRWFTKSKGMDGSMFFLGTMYEQGLGVEKNAQISHDWYLKAAMAGNETAAGMFNSFKLEAYFFRDGNTSGYKYALILPNNIKRTVTSPWLEDIKETESQYFVDRTTYDIYVGPKVYGLRADGTVKTFYALKFKNGDGKKYVKFRFLNSKDEIKEICCDCDIFKFVDCSSIPDENINIVDLTK